MSVHELHFPFDIEMSSIMESFKNPVAKSCFKNNLDAFSFQNISFMMWLLPRICSNIFGYAADHMLNDHAVLYLTLRYWWLVWEL